jgi:DNA primase
MNPVLASFVDEACKLGRAAAPSQKRWNEVIVETPLVSLTKKDVFNYYSEPTVRRAMMKDMKDREVIVRQSFTPEYVILKRKEGGNVIRIEQDKKAVDNPKDFSYFTERRTTEFHPVFKKDEDRLVVDLDPRPNFPFHDTKTYAGQVASLMESLPGVKSTEVRFSGGRGFYVIGKLRKAININTGRKVLKETLAPLVEMDERLTLGVPSEDDQMRLDLTPVKERGSVRGVFSLNANTGLVSVPVTDLKDFDPKKHATIEAVLGRKPRESKHAR